MKSGFGEKIKSLQTGVGTMQLLDNVKMSIVEEFGVNTQPGRGAVDVFGAYRTENRTPPPVPERFPRGNVPLRRVLVFYDGNVTLCGEGGRCGRRRSEKGAVACRN